MVTVLPIIPESLVTPTVPIVKGVVVDVVFAIPIIESVTCFTIDYENSNAIGSRDRPSIRVWSHLTKSDVKKWKKNLQASLNKDLDIEIKKENFICAYKFCYVFGLEKYCNRLECYNKSIIVVGNRI